MRRATARQILIATIPALASLQHPSQEVTLERITPIITVEAIEPCLQFWMGSLGFDLAASLPEKGSLAFAMLQKGELEVMYQTRASIEADLGVSGAPETLGRELSGATTTLYIEVDALDPVVAAIGDGATVVVPRRRTEYGMDEVFVRPPCGTLVGFATRVR